VFIRSISVPDKYVTRNAVEPVQTFAGSGRLTCPVYMTIEVTGDFSCLTLKY
jgi:hypothetical protein